MSTKSKPEIVQSDTIDNVQTVGSVNQMYTKYLREIDKYRSIAESPNIGLNTNTSGRNEQNCNEEDLARQLNSLDVNVDKLVESRAHAFYRLLGLPVVTSSGKYYNPGHDPNQTKTFTARKTINESFNTDDFDTSELGKSREIQYKDRVNIFENLDRISSVYAILISVPKPFLMINDSSEVNPFEIDNQTRTVNGRKEIIDSLNNITLADVPDFAINPVHTLKPFMVIPEIDASVTEAFKRRVCVPFLATKAETRTTPQDYLPRPMIEYIIEKRLSTSTVSEAFTARAKRVLDSLSISDTTDVDIVDTISALTGEFSASNISIEDVGSLSTIQSSTILAFIKSIKLCVTELNKASKDFTDKRDEIKLQPVPDVDGPEFGGKVATTNTIEEISEQQKKINDLDFKRTISEDLSAQDEEVVEQIGDDAFPMQPSVDNVTKNTDSDINKIRGKIRNYGNKIISDLRRIEIITGEISGLGLVDVLAMYTALWAIDMRYLIGMLDQNALTRLNENFPQLVNDEVKRQIDNDRPNIVESLAAFEDKLINILSFADKLVTQYNQSPKKAKKGTIE